MSIFAILEQANEAQVPENKEVTASAAFLLTLLGSADDMAPGEELSQLVEADAVLDVLGNGMERLQSHLDTFTNSIADGGLTLQSFEALTDTLTRDCGLVGHVFTSVSAESINKPGGRLDATELSVEGIKESFDKGWKKVVDFFNMVIDKVVATFNKYATTFGRFKTKSEALSSIAKDLKGTLPKDAKVKVSKEFYLGTKVATIKDLQDAIKMLSRYGKGKEVATAIAEVATAYAGAKVTTDAEATAANTEILNAQNKLADAIEKALDITGDLKDLPKKQLPDENEYETVKATENMIGNFKIVLGKPGDKTDRVPSVIALPTDHKVKGEEITALGSSDIKSYADACADLAKVLTEMAEGFDAKKPKDVIKGADALKKALKGADISEAETKKIQERLKQVKGIAKLCREPAMSIVTRMASVGTAAYNIAYKSAKAHKE